MQENKNKILLDDSELVVLFCSFSLRVWHRHGQICLWMSGEQGRHVEASLLSGKTGTEKMKTVLKNK